MIRNNGRKGSLVYFSFMAMFVVVGAVTGNTMFLQYVETLSLDTSQDSVEQYQSFVIREEIMNAECATVRRGVFDWDAIENGDLECIGIPDENIVVWFGVWDDDEDTDEVTMPYIIESGDPSNVEDPGITDWGGMLMDDLIDGSMYPALVWNEDEERYQRAVVGFHREGAWRDVLPL